MSLRKQILFDAHIKDEDPGLNLYCKTDTIITVQVLMKAELKFRYCNGW